MFKLSSDKVKKPLFFAIVFAAALLLLLAATQIFSVSVIEIHGAADLKGLTSIKKKFILAVSTTVEAERLYRLNPELDSVEVVKHLPNKLVIAVEKAKMVAALTAAEGYFYLSSQGRLIAKKKDHQPGLPLINYYQRLHFAGYRVGESLTNKDILFSLFFIDRANGEGAGINAVDINSLDMLVLKSDDKTYLFTTDKDQNLQYDEWSQVVRRLKIENIDYTTLDLRFDKPIIKVL